MAATGNSLAENVSRWEVLVTNSQDIVGEMPHITEDLTALAELLPQVRTLESRQEDLRAQAREVNSQLREAARQGSKLRGRLVFSLQARFGADGEMLAKFGLRPRRPGRRRPAAPETTSPQS